ncbi:MAG: hypothetical protein IJ086_00660 [Clostridium sp.]|nr:hypothetical protein [Clostridium sp.]
MKKMMKYIKALELVNLTVENKILHEKDGHIAMYMTFEDREDGWYLMPKEYAVQDLMRKKDGQDLIISKLLDMGITFEPEYTDYI